MEHFNTAANLVLLIVLIIWGYDQIRQWQRNRYDRHMRKQVARLIGRIYVVKQVTPLLNTYRTQIGAEVHLLHEGSAPSITLALGQGHYNLTDDLGGLRGKQIIIRYKENLAMQDPNDEDRPAHHSEYSYWLKMEAI